ncbi:YciI family protein [Jidongwangia harbinensis]|uniref:YciI family protein n=1 Tax=Jidongwangia harbinensis TaxID=2878561 RepID=UPI001CD9CF3A|nr:YciI family protein [Jidongwangia harbinensis]MCA2218270.1 YciI family protein [Jidongwangia harbinensis]
MKFMIMLFEKDTDWQAAPPEELEAALAEHGAFTKMLQDKGIAYSGEAVKDSGSAVTLRRAGDGDTLTATEGPFAPGQPAQLAGFYVIDVKDLDEAVEIARMCPTGAATEVRPIWESAA